MKDKDNEPFAGSMRFGLNEKGYGWQDVVILKYIILYKWRDR